MGSNFLHFGENELGVILMESHIGKLMQLYD